MADQLSLGLKVDGLDVGRAQRDEALQRFEGNSWVWEMRRVAAGLAAERSRVNIDQVREAGPPKPERLSDNAWGSILGKPYFYKGSAVQSSRAVAHARWMFWWALTSQGRRELLEEP